MLPLLRYVFGILLIAGGLCSFAVFGRLPAILLGTPLILLGATLLSLPELLKRKGVAPERARRLFWLVLAGALFSPVAITLVLLIGGAIFNILLSLSADVGGFVVAAALPGGAIMTAGLAQLIVRTREQRTSVTGLSLIIYGAAVTVAGLSGALSLSTESGTDPLVLIASLFVGALALGAGVAIQVKARSKMVAAPPGEIAPPASAQPADTSPAVSAPEPAQKAHWPPAPASFDPAISRQCPKCGYVMDISMHDCPRCVNAAEHPPISTKRDSAPSGAQRALGALGGLAAVLLGCMASIVLIVLSPYSQEHLEASTTAMAILGWIPGGLWPLFVFRRVRWREISTGALAGGVAVPVAMALAVPAAIGGSLLVGLLSVLLPGTAATSDREQMVATIVTLVFAAPFVGAICGFIWGKIIGGGEAAKKAVIASVIGGLLAAVVVPSTTWSLAAAAPPTESWVDIHQWNWEYLPMVFGALAFSSAIAGWSLTGMDFEKRKLGALNTDNYHIQP